MVNHNQEIKALLEKLASGSINESEMQTLEHLAQEDPFLRDAIEGYEMSGDQIENLRALQGNFSPKQIRSKRLSQRPYLRIAASILLLISVAGVIYYSNQSLNQSSAEHTISMMKEESTISDLDAAAEVPRSVQNSPVPSPPPAKQAPPEAETILDQREKKISITEADGADEAAPNGEIEYNQANEAHISSIRPLEGRIFDDIGSPLIGAEIRLLDKDTVLYSDLEGRFVLTPEDAQQGMQISYVGYMTKKVEKINQSSIGKITLQEDPATLAEIVVTNSRNSSGPAQKNELSRAEAPGSVTEPLVGWPRYYAYLKQNLKKPRAAKKANVAGFVTLSFTIDQAGIPQNIIVRKSLGYGCDEEAIRLLEEGPRWRFPNDDTSRTELSIHYD